MTSGRKTLLILAVLYAVAVAVITIVPLHATTDRTTRVNVVPLASVAACLSGKSHDVHHIPRRCIGNVVGNILLFMPFGVLFAALANRHRSALTLLCAAAVSSASIELIQFAERNVPIGRTVDIDDVLWNTLGALAGYLILETWRARLHASRR